MSFTKLRLLCLPVLLMFVLITSGCLGRTSLSETYYYAVNSHDKGGNTNYYRLRLTGHSILSKTQYRHGYFPARAVDAFLGNVQLDKGARELEVEERLMAIVDAGTEKAWRDYVSATVDNGKKDKDDKNETKQLAKKSEIRRNLLEYPQKSLRQLEIDYNPAGNIITTNSNDKLIFFLSSNPDEVMSRIASFAEDEKTIQSVNRISQLIADPKSRDLQTLTIQNQLLENQLKTIASKMKSANEEPLDDASKSEQTMAELLILFNSVLTEVKP